jgi:hypothetical protein
MSRAGFSFGSGEGVFFLCFRMQEYGKILTDCSVTSAQHLLFRRADDNIVSLCDG